MLHSHRLAWATSPWGHFFDSASPGWQSVLSFIFLSLFCFNMSQVGNRIFFFNCTVQVLSKVTQNHTTEVNYRCFYLFLVLKILRWHRQCFLSSFPAWICANACVWFIRLLQWVGQLKYGLKSKAEAKKRNKRHTITVLIKFASISVAKVNFKVKCQAKGRWGCGCAVRWCQTRVARCFMNSICKEMRKREGLSAKTVMRVSSRISQTKSFACFSYLPELLSLSCRTNNSSLW